MTYSLYLPEITLDSGYRMDGGGKKEGGQRVQRSEMEMIWTNESAEK